MSLFLAFLYPAFYLVFQLLAPRGFVFSGMVDGDDGTLMAVVVSVNHNLEGLWALEEPKNIFLNPNMSSPFLFVPLGYLAKFLGDQFLLVFQVSRFLGALFFLISTYIFLKEFFGEKRAFRIFLLFCLSFGLGGLLFLTQKTAVPRVPWVGMWQPLTYEMFEGAGLIPLTALGRPYYTITLACGFLSLIFLKKEKFLWGGFLLGSAFLLYPTLGVAFGAISVLYILVTKGLRQNWSPVFLYFRSNPDVNRGEERKEDSKGGYSFGRNWSPILLYYLISAVGVLPWIGAYLTDSTMFQFYSDRRIAARPLALLISVATHLPFAALVIYEGLKRKKHFLVLASLLAIFLLGPKIPLRSFLRYASFLGFLGFLVFELRAKKELLFFTLWFLGAFFMAVLPPQRTIFFPARFMLVVWLPLVILSYLGMEKLVELTKNKISVGFLAALLIVLTFPSAAFFSTRFLRKPLEPTDWPLLPDYLFVNEMQAHKFLKDQPDGVVFCSEEIGMNLPVLTGKKSVLGREPVVRDHKIKMADYGRFFSDGSGAFDRQEIIEKYGIDYIYFGEYERVVSGFKLNLEKEDFLELIFEEPGVQIFEVK